MNIIQSITKTVLGVGIAAPPIVAGAAPQIALIPEQYLIGLCLFVSCVGGTYASFSWGEPVEPRSKMARLSVACIIMGLAFTAVVNFTLSHWLGVDLTLGVRSAIGAIVSCLTRFIMPKIIDSIKDGTWRELIPFIRKKDAP